MNNISDPRVHLSDAFAQLSNKLAELIKKNGGHLLLVGGTVRDLLLKQSPEELDCEVRGIQVEKLKSILSQKFSCDEVGKAFGVLRLKGLPVEIALPRTEKKSGSGHKGFEIEIYFQRDVSDYLKTITPDVYADGKEYKKRLCIQQNKRPTGAVTGALVAFPWFEANASEAANFDNEVWQGKREIFIKVK